MTRADASGRATIFVKQLGDMPTCSGLSSDALSWLGSVVTEVHFAAADRLITEGETDRDCYFLVDGEVEVEMGGQKVGTVGPGRLSP
jgi:CRP-like cAMP-binding protein